MKTPFLWPSTSCHRGTYFWFSLSAVSLYAAVYLWSYVEGHRPKVSLAFLALALVGCVLGILRSRRETLGDESAPSAASTKRMKGVLFAAITIHVIVATTAVVLLPGKVIDVFTMHTAALQALVKGINPYTITQENIYDTLHTALYYPPGTFVDSHLQVGFPYPPFCLLLGLPGYLLGDIRFSHIAAIVISALLMAGIRLNWFTVGAACLFLLNPLTFLIERFSWTDAFVLLPLCATVYAAVKRRWWLPVALGLFFASKQYAILGIPFVFLLKDYNWKASLKLLLQSLCVTAAVTLPFALWNLSHFVHDTVLFQMRSPFRPDSLSFAVLSPIPFSLIVLAILAATVWSLAVAKHDPAMFAACFGFSLLIFVCPNKQAFGNYYFLVAQSLWLALTAFAVGSNTSAEIPKNKEQKISVG